MGPGNRFALFQNGIGTKRTRTIKPLQNLITFFPDILLAGPVPQRIPQFFIHIYDLIGFHIRNIYQFIQFLKKNPIKNPLSSFLSSAFLIGNQPSLFSPVFCRKLCKRPLIVSLSLVSYIYFAVFYILSTLFFILLIALYRLLSYLPAVFQISVLSYPQKFLFYWPLEKCLFPARAISPAFCGNVLGLRKPGTTR